MRFDVVEERRPAVEASQHAGDCLPDDTYDGEACCPLGDVETS